MPTSEIGLPRTAEPRPARDAGFTLTEVLVVMFLIALASAAVVVSLPPPPPPALEDARRFAARVALAADEAVIAGRHMGLRANAGGYVFLTSRRGVWSPAADARRLGPARWSPDVEVRLTLVEEQASAIAAAGDGDAPPPPAVVFDPIGSVTPFRLVVTGPETRWRVSVDPAGAIDLEALE